MQVSKFNNQKGGKMKVCRKLKLSMLFGSFFISSLAFSADPKAVRDELETFLTGKGAPRLGSGNRKMKGKEADKEGAADKTWDILDLNFGGLNVLDSGNSLLDKFVVPKEKTVPGLICTIFVKAGDHFVRAATTAKSGPKRCSGTPIDPTKPVHAALSGKQEFNGEAPICGPTYNASYKPIVIADKVIGAYLCAIKK